MQQPSSLAGTRAEALGCSQAAIGALANTEMFLEGFTFQPNRNGILGDPSYSYGPS